MSSENTDHITIRVKRTSGVAVGSRQLRVEPTNVDLRDTSLADEAVSHQKQTFTRWINEQLRKHAARISPASGARKSNAKSGKEQVSIENGALHGDVDSDHFNQDNENPSEIVPKRVINIEEDLQDGVILTSLTEVLSGKRIRRANRATDLQRTQKLDNVSTVLKRLEEDGIRLVNISSSDIVDGNLKLTLGLTWTLIRYYSIAKAQWDAARTRSHSDGVEPDSDSSARRRLLEWINQRLPSDFRVRNFNSDWTDGRAICALVNACVPGSFTDWRGVAAANARESVRRALEIAESRLGIAKLIEPDDMLTPAIDERVMMTYLSQFPNAQRVPVEQPLDNESEPTYLNASAIAPVQRERADPRALFDEYAGHSHSKWRPLRESELRPPSSFEPEAFRVVRKRTKKKNSDLGAAEQPIAADKYNEQVLAADTEQIYDTYKLFERVDDHAITVSQTDHSSFRELIWQLVYAREIQDDLEKVRVLFMWLCTKDLSKLHFDTVMRDSPEEKLLQIRDGLITYTEVFELLCSYAGVQCEVIDGYVKTHPYAPGMRVADPLEEPTAGDDVDADGEGVYDNPSDLENDYSNTPSHRNGRAKSKNHNQNDRTVGDALRSRWNAVLIHGTWQLIDCNWAARSLVFDERNSKAPRQSVVSKSSMLRDSNCVKYRLHTFYFLPNPIDFLYTHFPDHPEWQLVGHPISLSEYEELSWLRSAFFQFGLELRSTCSAVIESSRSEVEIIVGQKGSAPPELSESQGLESFSAHSDGVQSRSASLADRMQFTFTYWFTNGADTYHGYPLWHYVMYEFINNDKDALFRIRLPVPNQQCRLTIYAKLREADPAIPSSDEFRAICEFALISRPPAGAANSNRSSLPPSATSSASRPSSNRSSVQVNSAPPSTPVQPVLPFPPCRDCLYGPSSFARQLGLRLTNQTGASAKYAELHNFLHVQDGNADLRITVNNSSSTPLNSLRFRAKLKAHSTITSALLFPLDRFVILRAAPRFNETRVTVFLPQAGEYALELFVLPPDAKPSANEDPYRFVWRFMLVSARPSALGEVLPPLPADMLLGAVPNVSAQMNIVSINQLDPFVSRAQFNENEVTIKLTSGVPIRTSVQMLRYSRRSREPSDFSNFVLQQQTVRSQIPASTMSGMSTYYSPPASSASNSSFGSSAMQYCSEIDLVVHLPQPGFYLLKLFAQPHADSSQHLLNVFNFLMCTLSPVIVNHTAGNTFPKQSSRWLEGCYLFQPLYERIVAARTPKGSVWFKLIVPGAYSVCVVVGDVWRALEKRMETWIGEINLYRITPKRDPNRLVICASFDEQREQYHNLLEYFVE